MTKVPDHSEVSKEETKPRFLSAAEWAEIVAHFEFGTMKVKAIKEKYKVSGSAISQHFDKCRRTGQMIGKFGCKAHLLDRREAIEKALEKTVEHVAEEVAKVATFASKRRARIEQQKEILYNASVANHVFFNGIQRSIKDGTLKPSQAANDLKALRHAEAFIERRIVNVYRLLDVDTDVDEAELPTLQFEDLTQEEIEEIQQLDDDPDLDVPDTPVEIGEEDIVDEGTS